MASAKTLVPMSFIARAFFGVYRTAFFAIPFATRVSSFFFWSRFSRRLIHGSEAYQGNVEPCEKEPVIWVHGVSMGESLVASAIAAQLRQEYPDHGIVFTTTHPDVLEAIERKDIAEVTSYFPLDSYLSMNKAFNIWRPSLVIVAETDFWPEFSFQCRRRKIPLVLVNGRISDKIATFYGGFGTGLGEVIFSAYSKLLVQNDIDAERLWRCGASPAKIEVLGNVKADLIGAASSQVAAEIAAWAVGNKPVVFGSLHPVEFENMFSVFATLRNAGRKIIVAPRNLKLSESWRRSLLEAGHSAELRTKLSASNTADVIILDTMGELSAVYSIAAAAFVGGTIDEKVGGHNPLEVVQQRVPLLMGPFYRNFTDIVDQLKLADAVAICEGAEGLAAELNAVLADADLAAKRVEAASEVLKANQGALKKTMQIIRSVYW